MSVTIKSPAEIEKMRYAGQLAAKVLRMIGPYVQPGVTTAELDRICHDYIVGTLQAVPAPLYYRGFPKSICTSVNHVVCHGIPGDKKLKDGNFKGFSEQVAVCILAKHPANVDVLMSMPIDAGSGQTVEEARQQLVAKIGENISVRRFFLHKLQGDRLGIYLHGTRIGVLIDMQSGDDNLAKDIAMHVAGHQPPPVCISENQIAPDTLEKEKEVFIAQARESGKPDNIIEKMVSGRIAKFKKEITLLGQPFVKDPDTTVDKLLAKAGARVNQFIRYEVGEGLEKRSDNFAEEVMAQARGE